MDEVIPRVVRHDVEVSVLHVVKVTLVACIDPNPLMRPSLDDVLEVLNTPNLFTSAALAEAASAPTPPA